MSRNEQTIVVDGVRVPESHVRRICRELAKLTLKREAGRKLAEHEARRELFLAGAVQAIQAAGC